ncbi:methyltransferase domain-containing protein [Stieleria sp. JC731]|uniref:putative RNA methyltransferase n=1 Tax=Pirellulaceae TaxID=2691357 RepID=UPI001E5F9542|nr:methyltransferase domain-containing protein [Stieleria sp. JC731]MCC9604126.1 methyltransferase domain-containing protein [Stieleria sp. JC731]
MFPLRCSVRGCEQPLHSSPPCLRCPSGHSFDIAREGYFNLTQPQDRRSKNPGDSDDAVLARQRWVDRGHMQGFIDELANLLQQADLGSDQATTIDLGCGEGSFGKALFSETPQQFCGIDLSKRAIRLASRNWPQANWTLANADRTLPIIDQSVQRVMSLFGRRPISEIDRVLDAEGICVVAVPGEEDLIELREQTQLTGERRSRWEAIADEFHNANLNLAEHRRWTHRVELDRSEITDALAMTYRAVRHSQQARLQDVDAMHVTLQADILLLRR